MRRIGVIPLLLLCALALTAQRGAYAASTPVVVASAAPAVVPVQLGESSTQLIGPWKFRTGDDPAWADPSFNDSTWATMNLSPADGSGPGWEGRGYPSYAGFAWYRLRVNIEGAKHRLALKMPDSADDAYQVFVNGKLVGEFGKFNAKRVVAYPSLPEAIVLPRGIENGVATIAIRMWMDSSTRFSVPDAGGLHGPPSLGYASLINDLVRLAYDDAAHYFGSAFLEALIVFMALLMAYALFWLDPQEKSYFWLTLVCTVTLLEDIIIVSVNFAAWVSQTTAVLLSEVIFGQARIGLWVLFWAYWFRNERIGRIQQIVWSLVGLLMLGRAMLRPPLYGQIVPLTFSAWLVPSLLIIKLALGAVLFYVVYRGFAIQKTEGGLALSAILLSFVANYQHEMQLVYVPTAVTVLGFTVQLGTVATVTSLLIITVMLLRRFIQAQALKEQWKLEIQQAQQVQQLLIPDELPTVPGLVIDSVYRPAREVGGDFFQISPMDPEGTAMIVLGDVTGKGVQAGMLVALILGAIRASMQHSSDPARILSEINDQLCERQGAIATCMILRIDPNGEVILANAGQLPPFLNGVELEMEGAFPIGMVPETEYTLTRLSLGPGDSLMLMSDGVVEAQDPEGTLFGFERVGEMLKVHASSEAIATSAQNFGQEDDILVLQISRESANVPEVLEPQNLVLS